MFHFFRSSCWQIKVRCAGPFMYAQFVMDFKRHKVRTSLDGILYTALALFPHFVRATLHLNILLTCKSHFQEEMNRGLFLSRRYS